MVHDDYLTFSGKCTLYNRMKIIEKTLLKSVLRNRSLADAAKTLGCCVNTLKKNMQQQDIDHKRKWKIIDKAILTSLLEHESQKEAAESLCCSITTLRKNIAHHKIEYRHKGKSHAIISSLPDILTSEQLEVLDGCMLGDGNLHPRSDVKARMKLSQAIIREEYLRDLYCTFHPFSTSWIERTTTVGRHPYVAFNTYGHPLFYKQWLRWYENGEKIVPRDLKLTQRTLLYWFCDDGNNLNGMLRFHTNGFRHEDVEFLRLRLLEDFGLHSHIVFPEGRPVITIGSRDAGSNKKLIDILKPMMKWECLRYKVYWDDAIRRRTGEKSL